MGLEGVELVIQMEDTFSISITDEEAENLITPRRAIDLIKKKVFIGSNDICMTQNAFYRLRTILVNDFEIQRNIISRESDLHRLIDKDKHEGLWDRIKEETNTSKLPSLSRPNWLVISAWVSFGAIAVISGGIYGYYIGFIVGVLALSLIFYVTRPLAKYIPSAYSKVNRIVRYLVVNNPGKFKKTNDWTEQQIHQLVKQIVIEVLGTEKYDENWEFVADYGIG